jgi:hypothetical protein
MNSIHFINISEKQPDSCMESNSLNEKAALHPRNNPDKFG